jgi:hypothetical protein
MGGGGHNKGQGYDGGGQELRVRGNAYQVLEKYLQLARDAGSAGDRVAAENFLQHADHYYRVLSAMNDGQRPRMGGRELSVADVNVQNVSQGLSAALYSSGGPNPQGDMQGDGMPGQNPGNQGGPSHGQSHAQSHGGQGQGGQTHSGGQGERQGERQGGHQGGHRQGGHQQAGHQQGNRAQGDGQGQNPQGAVGGNVAPTNGHGTTYDNYADRNPQQASYVPPAEPARAPAPPVSEDQPDYPEELLATTAAPPAAEAAPDDAEDGVQRTLRTPRPRQRGPRRGPRQGDGRQEGRQGEPQGPGPAEPTE